VGGKSKKGGEKAPRERIGKTEKAAGKGKGKAEEKESGSELSELEDKDMVRLAESMGWEKDLVKFAGIGGQ
jgi:hypothetical protein